MLKVVKNVIEHILTFHWLPDAKGLAISFPSIWIEENKAKTVALAECFPTLVSWVFSNPQRSTNFVFRRIIYHAGATGQHMTSRQQGFINFFSFLRPGPGCRQSEGPWQNGRFPSLPGPGSRLVVGRYTFILLYSFKANFFKNGFASKFFLRLISSCILCLMDSLPGIGESTRRYCNG